MNAATREAKKHMDKSKDNVLSIIAIIVAVSIAIVALGFSISLVIKAVGAAWGIVVGAEAISDVASIWSARIAAVGLGAAGITVCIKLVVESRGAIKENPKQWAVPLLAISAGILVDIDKEFTSDGTVEKIIFSALSVLLIYVGSVIFGRAGKVWKISGVLLMFLPPIFVLAGIFLNSSGNTFQESMAEVSLQKWAIFGIVFLLASLVLWLSALSTKDA